jgi:hypothetical protein
MRTLSLMNCMLAVGIVQAYAQAPQVPADLQARYIKACIHAGDTEGYCRCEFNIVKDNKGAMALIDVLIRINELPDDEARKSYFAKLSADEAQRIIFVADEINGVALKKCPDVRPQ